MLIGIITGATTGASIQEILTVERISVDCFRWMILASQTFAPIGLLASFHRMLNQYVALDPINGS